MALLNCPCCGRLIPSDAKGRVSAHPVEPQHGERQNCRGTGHRPAPRESVAVQTVSGVLSIALAVLAGLGIYR